MRSSGLRSSFPYLHPVKSQLLRDVAVIYPAKGFAEGQTRLRRRRKVICFVGRAGTRPSLFLFSSNVATEPVSIIRHLIAFPSISASSNR